MDADSAGDAGTNVARKEANSGKDEKPLEKSNMIYGGKSEVFSLTKHFSTSHLP